MRRRCLIFFILIIYLVFLNQIVFSKSYSSGPYSNGLRITENSTLTGGTYDIKGDFTINSGVTLTVKNTTTLNVEGNINIFGKIVTDKVKLNLSMISSNGNILIKNSINVYSAQGLPGRNGEDSYNGSKGGDGKTSNLYLIANKGDILKYFEYRWYRRKRWRWRK
ncbi:hypothetical protein BBF96_01900 [Anoxybacter fermentans]|uniref:Uncharacterized protein n=1 Tax=Anoxybacter fermentans TaxID=1323375 RepID=A0A3Q9HP63_9FIRM|nr:hypothetical protein [Anoxybacter fermentans]AZR72258.1 hypothetical protein BBF96_01900 [Anoxybacter fermentans]